MSTFLGWGNGHDGDATPSGDINTRVSCSGASGSKTLTVSSTAGFVVGDMVFIQQVRGTGVGGVEIGTVNSITGTLNLTHNLTNTYTDSGASQAQCVLMPQYRSATISGTVSPGDWAGNTGGVVAFACSGRTLLTGTITATGKGFVGGASSGAQASQGEGTSSAGSASTAANGSGGGGGLASPGKRAGGGGGGHKNSGTTGGVAGNGHDGTPGTGGGTSGLAALTTMTFGGAGGGGGYEVNISPKGGDGGGIILIFSKVIDISSGIISAGGNDSGDGGWGTSGGGAGGSVLIKAQNAVMGTNKITVTAGVAGTPDGGDTAKGGNGSVGRRRVEACSITGSGYADSEVEGGQSWCGSIATIIE